MKLEWKEYPLADGFSYFVAKIGQVRFDVAKLEGVKDTPDGWAWNAHWQHRSFQESVGHKFGLASREAAMAAAEEWASSNVKTLRDSRPATGEK